MVEYQIRNRHRLRKKVARELCLRLYDIFSEDLAIDHTAIDLANVDNFEILIIENAIVGFIITDQPFLTIRGLLKYRPCNRYVTVDMGAVSFVSNGADIMSPGIVDADTNIGTGELIWVRDVNNLQPLAIGRSLMTGPEMVKSTTDKAVESLHYVGDKLWNLSIKD